MCVQEAETEKGAAGMAANPNDHQMWPLAALKSLGLSLALFQEPEGHKLVKNVMLIQLQFHVSLSSISVLLGFLFIVYQCLGSLWLNSLTSQTDYTVLMTNDLSVDWFGNDPSCKCILWAFPIRRSCDDAVTQVSFCLSGTRRCERVCQGSPPLGCFAPATQAFFVLLCLQTSQAPLPGSSWWCLALMTWVSSHTVSCQSLSLISLLAFYSLCPFIVPVNL